MCYSTKSNFFHQLNTPSHLRTNATAVIWQCHVLTTIGDGEIVKLACPMYSRCIKKRWSVTILLRRMIVPMATAPWHWSVAQPDQGMSRDDNPASCASPL